MFFLGFCHPNLKVHRQETSHASHSEAAAVGTDRAQATQTTRKEHVELWGAEINADYLWEAAPGTGDPPAAARGAGHSKNSVPCAHITIQKLI